MNKIQYLSVWLGATSICLLIFITEAAAASPAVHKYTPKMTVASLASKPDTDIIQFANGRQLSVRGFRRLDRIAKKLRAPRVNKKPAAFRFQPNPGKIKLKINTASDLKQALKLDDRDTVQLPSGRLATAAQIKFAQPMVEKRLGFKLSSLPQRPDTYGTALKIAPNTNKKEWGKILKKPENTIIESPDGARITVGELKDYLKQRLTKKSKASSQTPKLSASKRVKK
jgi:hypothetical protein